MYIHIYTKHINNCKIRLIVAVVDHCDITVTNPFVLPRPYYDVKQASVSTQFNMEYSFYLELNLRRS